MGIEGQNFNQEYLKKEKYFEKQNRIKGDQILNNMQLSKLCSIAPKRR